MNEQGNMTPETVRSRATGKVVRLEFTAECFIMTGPTGTHTLQRDETTEERLRAHWDGFCQMNDAQNDSQRRAAANPKLVPSSEAAVKELQRAEYLIELVRGRIEAELEQAREYNTNWAEAGDSQKLVSDLLNLSTIDGDDKGDLLAEIDAELGQ